VNHNRARRAQTGRRRRVARAPIYDRMRTICSGVVFRDVIDLHCHVLPGIDDGPPSIDGSLALARAASAAGIETLVATPHVSARYRNDATTIARLVEDLNAQLAAESIALEVRAGAELAATQIGELEPAELDRLGLGGGSWLLLEPPFAAVVTGLEEIAAELQDRGHRLLLAHPERCEAFQRDPRTLHALVRGGVCTSITASSLVGRFGTKPRRFALGMLKQGLVHNVTSDAHDDVRRPPGMAAEIADAGFAPLTEWLTHDVPAAILADRELPPRPARAGGGFAARAGRLWRKRD
jgi:protein-tyrosine phosphatase